MNHDPKAYCEYCEEVGHGIIDHANSGPLCVCQHYLDDHHRSWFRNGFELAEECEYYGYNESGGMKQNAEGRWVDHCQRFRKAEDEH